MFSYQPEILDYLKGVTDKYGLRRYIRFNSHVTRAHWDDDEYRWHVFTEIRTGVRRAVCDLRRRRTAYSVLARYPRPRRLPRTGLSHRAVEPRRRLDRETGRGDRDRRQCHPGRTRTGEDRRPGAAVSAHGRLDQAPDQLRVPACGATRVRGGSRAACGTANGHVLDLGQQGGRAGKATATDEGRRVDVQGEHAALHQGSGTAGQADTALPRRLQANSYLRQLLSSRRRTRRPR